MGENEQVDGCTTGGLPEDRDLGRITSKGSDVALHPVKTKTLIK